jgi:hypothetical protein
MDHRTFSLPERALALLAGIINLIVGLGFFFLPELLHGLPFPLWPVSISPILTRFIGAIIIGNGFAAIWLSREREWARVRPLAIVAVVYGTLVAGALLYHLLWLHAAASFWLYFLFDVPFLVVFYALFIYHDIAPLIRQQSVKQPGRQTVKQQR